MMHDDSGGTRSIGGFAIVVTSTVGLLASLRRRRDDGVPTELMFANTNFIMGCRAMTASLRARETMIVNDGIGMDLASRLFYRRPFPENLAGTDFVPRFLAQLDRPTRVFLLGARPAVVQGTAAIWDREFEQLEIVGTADGYAGMADPDALLARIRNASPDILMLALGDPRQAQWITSYRGRHDVPLVMAVGALFDFVSKTVPRAPALVRKLRLEWLYRLANEPRRLLKRYSVDLVAFFAHCIAVDRNERVGDPAGARRRRS